MPEENYPRTALILPLNLDEVVATAMLLGEYVPRECANCRGKGREWLITGFSRCAVCRGRGIVGISLRTWKFMGYDKMKYWQLVTSGGNKYG